jgi:DNA repair protein RadD
MTNIECFNWLLAEGYLAPLIPKPTKTVLDISNVSISGGEYKQNELQAAVDIDAINHAACMEMITQGHDRKHWLIFASGIDHAVHLANALNHYDIKATYVHSKMPDSERDENIRAWKNGEYQAMVNNGILTTGVDFPAINLIGVLRPTRSASLWVQMLGRGTRPHPGKANCLVLDFANNITRLGPINDPICPRRRGKGAPRPAPVKLCNFCESWNHTSVRNCVVCGTAFPVEINIEGVANSQQLIVGAEDMRTEVFKVDSVVYNEHYKIGRPPSLRVSYFCGLRRFIEWIAFEHSAESNRMARRWWARRAPDYDMPPDTTEEALANVRTLKQPTHLRIWLKPKYDSILDYDFTGTAFGENTNDD